MKKIGKYILWFLGITVWFFFLTPFWMADMTHGSHTHQLIIIFTGICLAIYIFRKTDSGAKEVKKENQELKAEVQKLRAELQAQAVRRAMDAVEKREKED